MKINTMRVKDFENLPSRKWDEDVGEFDSLVILPAQVTLLNRLKFKTRFYLRKYFPKIFSEVYCWELEGIHDSGYRCMDFVAVRKEEAICKLSGCSDVLHFDGIESYEKEKNFRTASVSAKNWSIDCLPISGLLRVFTGKPLTCGEALSSFEIYSKGRDK